MPSLLRASVAILSLLAATAARADDLVILSAAAVRPALIQLPALFEKATRHRVTVSFGNATAINTKVVDGDRVDVVILPPRQLTALIGHGHLSADGRADLGVVRLGVAVRAGSATPPVGTADEFKQAMLAAASFGMPDPADGSTSSQHMVKLLAQLGIADAMRPKIRHFKDGTEALHALCQGRDRAHHCADDLDPRGAGYRTGRIAAGRLAEHDRLCGGTVAQIGGVGAGESAAGDTHFIGLCDDPA